MYLCFAENYNPDATDDDGSCTVADCDPVEEGGCNLEADLNGDGFVGTGDLLDFHQFELSAHLKQLSLVVTPSTIKDMITRRCKSESNVSLLKT